MLVSRGSKIRLNEARPARVSQVSSIFEQGALLGGCRIQESRVSR